MKNIKLTLLAAATTGAISLGSAYAMPISNLAAAAADQNDVEKVRVVCNRYGHCYRTYRSARRYYSPGYYYGPRYYAPYYGYPRYGYYGPRFGFGIGPFGFGVW